MKESSGNKVYGLYLSIRAKIFGLVKKYYDPVIKVSIGRRKIYMNVSHQLPVYRARFPYYDTALTRVCCFLKERQGYLTMIDAGANIGDAVSLIADEVSGNFLCLEAKKSYFRLLLRNLRNFPNIVCENVLVSDTCGIADASLVGAGGTAHLAVASSSGKKESLQTMTIDKLAQKHEKFLKSNILKIDTDGYDYKVIRGSSGLLNTAKPALFFELAPYYLTQIGNEDPASIFNYLAMRGYTTALFYDNVGFPVIMIDSRDSILLSRLINYASIKNNYYFDVFTFHDSHKELLEEFYQNEVKFFPKYKWF